MALKINTLVLGMALLFGVGFMQSMPAEEVQDWRVYIGTYTGGKSEGIYLLQLNGETGMLGGPVLAVATDNPSFLALHPHKPFMYSVGDGKSEEGGRKGYVSAFSIHPEDGSLVFLNREDVVGKGPCHVAVDRAGKHVLVANYGSGSVAVLPIGEDGKVHPASDLEQHEGSSVNPRRQEGPHAHSVTLDNPGKYAFVADLGIDKIMVYRYDEELGHLEPNTPAYATVDPGAGPRHFAFHPSGNYAYSVNELANTVTVFSYDPGTGRLEAKQTIGTLPAGYEKENTTAEIRVHPSGKYVYASNRGHDSIATFSVEEKSGLLTSMGQISTGGRVPRNFNVSPDGRLLVAANQQSDTVTVFRMNSETGGLETVGAPVEVPMPVCVLFLPVSEK